MKRIRRYINIFRGVRIPWVILGAVLIINFVSSHTELAQATITADVIDSSQKAIDGAMLVRFMVILAANALLTIVRIYGAGWADQKINLEVRTKLWNKLMRLPTRYYDGESGDALVSRITTDTNYSCYYFDIAIKIVTAVYATAVTAGQMYSYSPELTGFMFLIVPVVVLFTWAFGRLSFIANQKAQATFSGSLAYLVERTRNLRLVKAARMEYREQAEGKRRFDRQFHVGFLSLLTDCGNLAVADLLTCSGLIISFVLGGQLVSAGQITSGRLVGFYALSGMLYVRLMQVIMYYVDMKGANGRLDKIAQVLESPDERTEGIELDVADEDIHVEDVSFAYQDMPVLRGVKCRIPKGKVTAIIGPNGAGKSTMFKLLERMYDPGQGAIRFGGTDVRTFDLPSWRQSFAIVSQDKPLLSGTVRENILYGTRRRVSEEELIRVAKLANVYDFVMATPGGFDAQVGEGGGSFSGGQRQCIAIARAMMRNPDYLLLDEATSNLDAVSEQLVGQALANLMKGRTTVMIAHSYPAIRGADHIIVMKDGQVEAQGSPEELLAVSEYYRTFAGKAV